jgi:hypothetical protein
VRVGESELHRLDLPVDALGRRGGPVEAFEDIERDERGNALPVRRQLPNLAVPVPRANRIDPRRRVLRQVLGGQQAAGCRGELGQPLPDLTPVKCVCLSLRDQA